MSPRTWHCEGELDFLVNLKISSVKSFVNVHKHFRSGNRPILTQTLHGIYAIQDIFEPVDISFPGRFDSK